MNISRAFANYIASEGFGTFGTDLFIGGAPLKAPDPLWWIVSSGGAPESKNSTGEMLKEYTLGVYYRNQDTEQVYEKLQALEELINSVGCVQLESYDTVSMEAVGFPADQDLDDEDRTVGLLQVGILIHQIS
jgi:hypothetical protein